MTSKDDNNEPGENRVIDSTWLLAFVGVLAIAIPITLLIVSALSPDVTQQQSVSHFYYTPLRDALMGALFAVSVFLFAYTGYAPKPGEWFSDRQVSLLAGLGLICVVVFPAEALKDHVKNIPSVAMFFPEGSKVLPWIHPIGAIAFMGSLGYMSLVNFRRARFAEKYRHQKQPLRQLTENGIYVLCGLVMLGCVGLMILQTLALPKGEMFFKNATFWFESIGIIFFGLSWLIKTKVLGIVLPG